MRGRPGSGGLDQSELRLVIHWPMRDGEETVLCAGSEREEEARDLEQPRAPGPGYCTVYCAVYCAHHYTQDFCNARVMYSIGFLELNHHYPWHSPYTRRTSIVWAVTLMLEWCLLRLSIRTEVCCLAWGLVSWLYMCLPGSSKKSITQHQHCKFHDLLSNMTDTSALLILTIIWVTDKFTSVSQMQYQ